MTAQDVVSSPHLAKLTVKDFLILSESGAFDNYARTELIEGEIWVANAVHRRHARVHALLTVELGIALKTNGSPFQLYAKHAVPEYWVADVEANLIHQMWSPRDEASAERREIAFGTTVEAATLPGLSVETAGL